MKKVVNLENVDIKQLISDKKAFCEFVYTPLLDAMEELPRRWKNKKLEKELRAYLGGDVPALLAGGFNAVLLRQLFTPNYELRRFMNVPDVFNVNPVFLEYHEDKFTSNNPLKNSLGKMRFQEGIGKKAHIKMESRNVINFAESDGMKIKEVVTVWGQPLVDFHHQLLERVFPNSTKYIFDASEWLRAQPGSIKEYYCRVLAFFVRNGILFEDFVLKGDELEFIEKKFLPSFIEVWKKNGKKPLIVALEPNDANGDLFWMFHHPEILKVVDKKLKKSGIF
ncbi:MAG: hypothetical protein PHS95_00375 [Candidatus Pacebacteria bacterium]|nr:hypothetical protein [Candidatus Paceibacterota bacterium]